MPRYSAASGAAMPIDYSRFNNIGDSDEEEVVIYIYISLCTYIHI